MSGKKRKSEVTDMIVALLESTKAACEKQLTVWEIAELCHCSKGHACNVKKWWQDGMVGNVADYIKQERPAGNYPRPGEYRKKGAASPPKIKVPCLGNQIDRPHFVVTTFREVGGRKIADMRLCGVCLKGATEAGRFEL